MGWRKWVDDALGLTRFGASAPAPTIYQHLGFTPENVADHVRRLVRR